MRTRFMTYMLFLSFFTAFPGRLFAQWTQVPNLQYARISGVLIVNDTTVFVGGYSGAFLESTDAGESWTPVTPKGMGTDSIFSLDQCGGYLFAGTSAPVSLYRSSDDGDSWSASGQGLPANTDVNDMTYLDSITFAATNNGVLSSTDNGSTWIADTAGLNLAQLVGAPPVVYGTIGITSSGSHLFAIESGTGNGVYSAATDSIEWKNIGLDTASSYAITTLDTSVFVGTDKGVFLYGGNAAWLNRSTGLPFSDSTSVTDVRFAGHDSLLFAYMEFNYSTHDLYFTTDLGKSWIKIELAGLGNSPVSVIAANGSYLFAGTQSGAYRIPISDLITDVESRQTQVPERFSLSQNYPNPFNPTTVIKFAVQGSRFVSLRVYNVLGQLVRTLVDKVESPGSHEVVFDGSGIASGVYFYRLSAKSSSGQAEDFTSVRKMILLK